MERNCQLRSQRFNELQFWTRCFEISIELVFQKFALFDLRKKYDKLRKAGIHVVTFILTETQQISLK